MHDESFRCNRFNAYRLLSYKMQISLLFSHEIKSSHANVAMIKVGVFIPLVLIRYSSESSMLLLVYSWINECMKSFRTILFCSCRPSSWRQQCRVFTIFSMSFEKQKVWKKFRNYRNLIEREKFDIIETCRKEMWNGTSKTSPNFRFKLALKYNLDERKFSVFLQTSTSQVWIQKFKSLSETKLELLCIHDKFVNKVRIFFLKFQFWQLA